MKLFDTTINSVLIGLAVLAAMYSLEVMNQINLVIK